MLLDIFWEDEKIKLAVLYIYRDSSLQIGFYNQSYELIEKSDRCKLLCIRTAIKMVPNKFKKFSILSIESVQNVLSCFSKNSIA